MDAPPEPNVSEPASGSETSADVGGPEVHQHAPEPAPAPPAPEPTQPPMAPPPPPPPMPMGPPPPEHTIKPVLGGICILIAAILALYSGAQLLFADAAIESMGVPIIGDFFSGLLTIMGAICFIFGIIELLGAVMAIKRKAWGLALIGGIFAIFTGYFILGLIGIILVAISKKEFS